jgi:arylsulfatase
MNTRAVSFVAVLLLFVVGRASAADAPTTRPNIVVILADDMGFSDLGCYGSEIETPNLDALAKGGVRFSQFYNTARCCPTRASLLTGLYPHQAGVGHMTGHSIKGHPGYQGELSKRTATIAEVLRPAGYATYMTGKWHVTSTARPDAPRDNWPVARGFDRYYGTVQGGGSYYDPAMLCRDSQPITPANDPEYQPPAGQKFYYTDAVADQSARFVREHKERNGGESGAGGKPFFMYVAFTSPHWPLHAPEETVAKYKGKYKGGYEPVRAARFERQKRMGLISADTKLTPAPWSWEQVENREWEQRCMEVYAAQVDRMDQGVGRIVSALKEAGQFENTLILFLVDNGGCAERMGRAVHIDRVRRPATRPIGADVVQTKVFPEYTRDGRPIWDGQAVMPGGDDSFVAYGEGWANVSNTPFTLYKHFTHEGGISTPLIAHWPKGFSARGEWERQPGHLIDLMPTFVALAGSVAKELPMEGVSLLPAFKGEPLRRERPIFFEHEGNRAVRDGKWKLVARGATGKWELYDMDADRSETSDLAASDPQRVEAMRKQWRAWAERSDVLPLNPWGAAVTSD